jgi:hypothetical protein
MPFKENFPFHRGAWAGDRFDLRFYKEVAQNFMFAHL